MKNFFKWIFKSNPKTFTAIGSILAGAVLAILSVLEHINWDLGNAIVPSIFATLGILFAGWAGLETNEQADNRKLDEAKELIEENSLNNKNDSE